MKHSPSALLSIFYQASHESNEHTHTHTHTQTPSNVSNLLLRRGFEYSIGLIMGCSFKLPDLSDTNQRIQHLLSVGIRFSALLQCNVITNKLPFLLFFFSTASPSIFFSSLGDITPCQRSLPLNRNILEE